MKSTCYFDGENKKGLDFRYLFTQAVNKPLFSQYFIFKLPANACIFYNIQKKMAPEYFF